jgi:hypothetical protein
MAPDAGGAAVPDLKFLAADLGKPNRCGIAIIEIPSSPNTTSMVIRYATYMAVRLKFSKHFPVVFAFRHMADSLDKEPSPITKAAQIAPRHIDLDQAQYDDRREFNPASDTQLATGGGRSARVEISDLVTRSPRAAARPAIKKGRWMLSGLSSRAARRVGCEPVSTTAASLRAPRRPSMGGGLESGEPSVRVAAARSALSMECRTMDIVSVVREGVCEVRHSVRVDL